MTQGEFASVYKVKLHDFCLPKFSINHQFQMIEAFVFDTPNCPYDFLLGCKFMKLTKMKLGFAKCETNWLRASVPFHPKGFFSGKTKLHQLLEHDSVHAKIAKSYSASHVHIKDAIYSTSRMPSTLSMAQTKLPRNCYT
jgi:hypothetical protein